MSFSLTIDPVNGVWVENHTDWYDHDSELYVIENTSIFYVATFDVFSWLFYIQIRKVISLRSASSINNFIQIPARSSNLLIHVLTCIEGFLETSVIC